MAYAYQSILDVSILPSLCDAGPYMQMMQGVFRLWMIYHFGDPSRIVDQNLKGKIWNSNPAASQIVIESHGAYKTEMTETRPGIIIKRQAWTQHRIGIANNRLMGVPADGSENYFTLWQGSHTLFCIAGTPAEAEILATEARADLSEFAPAVRRQLDLIRLEVAQVGEYGMLEESGKNYVVPINVGYAIGETWIMRQEAPFLKSIDVSILFGS